MNRFHQVALVFLVNLEGKVLAQHRTDDAPVEPGKWTIPGGGIEPGEEPIEAAHRELLEETGLKVGALEEFRTIDHSYADDRTVAFHVFTGRTDATQEDVILGEGQAMEFLTPGELLAKPLTWINEDVLPDLLTSLAE